MSLSIFHHSIFDRIKSSLAKVGRVSLVSQLFERVFHRQDYLEKIYLRRLIIRYFISLLALTIILSLSYSVDLLSFSRTQAIFRPAPANLTLDTLSSDLASTYASASHYSTKLGFIYQSSLVFIFLLTTTTSLYLFFRHWRWQTRIVIKHIVLLIVFQLFYLLPFSMLIYVPDNVVGKLISAEKSEIDQGISLITADPSSLGILTDPGDIVASIVTLDQAPKLIVGDYGSGILTQYFDILPQDTFVRGRIIPYLISTHAPITFPHQAILFPGGRITLSPSISQLDLESILAVLAVKSFTSSPYHYLLPKSLSPSIRLLTVDDYNELENKKLALEQAKIEQYLADLAEELVQNQRYIKQAELDLQSLKSDKEEYQNRVNPLLAECLSLYGEADCSEAKEIIANTLSDYDQVIANVETNITTAKNYTPNLQRAQSSAKQSLTSFLSFPIIPELQAGIFEPPSSILVKYDPSRYAPENYYYTLLHELAHYYSYRSTSDQPSFLEEGITDYFSTIVGGGVVSEKLKIDGYPYEIQIAQTLVERLGEEKVIELYFAKSAKNWTSALTPLCGKNCYSDLVKIGQQLTYADLDDRETRKNLTSGALDLLAGL